MLLFNGATDSFCTLNYGAIDYFHSFCCESIGRSRGHDKFLNSWDRGQPIFCQGIFNSAVIIFRVVIRGHRLLAFLFQRGMVNFVLKILGYTGS